MDQSNRSRAFQFYPVDIQRRILREYDADALSYVHGLLEQLEFDRVIRCALFIAHGTIDGLKKAVALGCLDYRDLIVAAEYDRSEQKIRDFNLPFPEDVKDGG